MEEKRAYISRSMIACLMLVMLVATFLFAAACGGETQQDAENAAEQPETTSTSPETTGSGDTTGPGGTTAEQALTPAEATVGPNEEANMAPAPGIGGDETRPPPADPPEGVRTYPATTNRNLEGDIEYDREPPTNGDHAPIWQNCGFYAEPVQNETAVHSMDHGAVWVTYRPGLPTEQVDTLRQLARERYVLVSPYPGQPAPVIATAWRNQLYLDSARDPRLNQFVEDFRLSETAPLAGNGCVRGEGTPEA